MKKAIIDLGSNTFHLLIAEIVDSKVVEHYRKRIFTGLCEGGIDFIRPASITIGLEALREFRDTLDNFDHDALIVTGTAALRSASNAHEFVTEAEQLLRTKIHIIDGLMEAGLIYEGTRIATNYSNSTSVIMDIGGGSTELIVVKDDVPIWSHSYKLGVGVLHALFHDAEPISQDSIQRLRAHVQLELKNFKGEVDTRSIKRLIGASGSFEVLETMTGHAVGIDSNTVIPLHDCYKLSHEIVSSDYEQRAKMPGLPASRVKLIVVAMLLIEEVLACIDVQDIEVTPYALKEGILASDLFTD